MPARPAALDAASLRILECLQQDSEISVADLAERVGLSTSPCWRRVNDLKEAGVIRGCVAVVDPLSLGLAVNVFVHVSLEKQTQAALQAFDEAVRYVQQRETFGKPLKEHQAIQFTAGLQLVESSQSMPHALLDLAFDPLVFDQQQILPTAGLLHA